MKTVWLTALALNIATQALSQSCAGRDVALGLLTSQHGETPIQSGTDRHGNTIELWVDTDDGSWTLTVTTAEAPDVVCLLTHGTDFKFAPAGRTQTDTY